MYRPVGRVSGFTLIELLIAIVIFAILMGIAVPNFAQLLRSNRLTGQANSLVSDILLARSESATRGSRVVICPSSNGTSCDSSNWADGRIVFIDTNSDNNADSGEVIVKVTAALHDSSLSETGNATKISFRPYGGLNPATSKTFKLCPSNNTEGRQILIAATGRPVASKVACN